MITQDLSTLDTGNLFEISLTRDNCYLLDLSSSNKALSKVNTKLANELGSYIFGKIEKNQKVAAVGGYLERRTIYQKSEVFKAELGFRNIHLGVDVWMKAQTPVFAPLDGIIHSQANNSDFGDYGPTVIIQHTLANGITFHSLYGHLSLESLNLHKPGDQIKKGTHIGWLGEEHENVGWPPHLHFQLILDMGTYKGDYPGVCSEHELPSLGRNCPDPTPLIFQA